MFFIVQAGRWVVVRAAPFGWRWVVKAFRSPVNKYLGTGPIPVLSTTAESTVVTEYIALVNVVAWVVGAWSPVGDQIIKLVDKIDPKLADQITPLVRLLTGGGGIGRPEAKVFDDGGPAVVQTTQQGHFEIAIGPAWRMDP